jgi:hypothetical protein
MKIAMAVKHGWAAVSLVDRIVPDGVCRPWLVTAGKAAIVNNSTKLSEHPSETGLQSAGC